MDKRPFIEKIKRFFLLIYLKLFRINDAPLRIALGFGLGVFTGLMPGTGPVAGLVLAFVFRVNRAAALAGCLLFNTWAGIVIFAASLKTGAWIMGRDEPAAYDAWNAALKNFTWHDIWHASLSALIPIAVGYFVISLAVSALLSVVVFVVVRLIRKQKLKRGKKESKN
ncbi:MAG: DUF2062 domain-containing protein [Candidatus Omnitrophica bacterium]|nr:DUF2062 domain-containing protein [Candidatus Omnitrophota bacterium]